MHYRYHVDKMGNEIAQRLERSRTIGAKLKDGISRIQNHIGFSVS
jgi:hypothetical protein